ncbi:MAG: zinc-ribbon domain-containing protein [Rhodopirellula sp.]|nr:zinc-ribbon domain-containing protein [Rhodopirellula sp.]
MYCPTCGRKIADGSRFCAECGARLDTPGLVTAQLVSPAIGTRDQERTPRLVFPKNPPLSPHLCWVNLILSGLAQMLHGQVAKGILLLVATIGSNLLLPILLALVIGAVSIVDAYMVGKTLRNGTPVGKWQWFPKA